MREKRFKARLVKQAALQAGQRVLDFGCGTGTLTVMLKKACPGAGVVGLDVDGDVLAIARTKAAAEGLDIDFKEAPATDPPFGTESFDCALSSLLFHHLRPEDKRRTLDKVFALLKPGGELHVADWGRPHDPVMRAAFLIVQLLDGVETTGDSVAGLLPGYMCDAGFSSVTETQRERTLFGTLAFYRAVKPARPATRALALDDPSFETVGRRAGPGLSAPAAYASREWLVWLIPPGPYGAPQWPKLADAAFLDVACGVVFVLRKESP